MNKYNTVPGLQECTLRHSSPICRNAWAAFLMVYDEFFLRGVSSMTMLDRMRRHRSWLKWSLGLVAVTMVIFFIPQDYLQPNVSVGAAPSETIAEVDGRTLLAGDFQQRYLRQMQQYRQQFGANVNE